VVRSCLAKHPAERPVSALELAERYETALADVVAAAPAPAPAALPAVVPAPRREPCDQAPPPTLDHDPTAIVQHLDAWMPEAIATYKLRGFVNDVGGEVVESGPGLIRVRLGGKGSVYWVPNGPLSWLGLGRKGQLIDMELRLERNNPVQQSLLHITVLMRSPDATAVSCPTFRARCNQVFCDLRAYLMGQAGAVTG
jgi:serine/threonine-protein kinase